MVYVVCIQCTDLNVRYCSRQTISQPIRWQHLVPQNQGIHDYNAIPNEAQFDSYTVQ